MLNLERALDWIAAKVEYESSRQGSLFDAGDETVFPLFAMEPCEEYGRQEMLDFEKALLGFYFTGHPMDDYRQIWERSVTLDLAHPEHATQDKEYVVVAMLVEFREIMTKAGRKMAFGLLEDYAGSIEIVVFPDTLELLRDRLSTDRVYCVKGTFDASRGKPSLQVKELLDPRSLKERSWRELHIRLAPAEGGAKYDEETMIGLRDAVYSLHGSCSLVFHVPLKEGGGEALVRAGAHIACSALDKDVEYLKSQPFVAEVWRD